MKSSIFSLSSDNQDPAFFPIPFSNQYQQISDLKLDSEVDIVDFGSENKLAVFPPNSFKMNFKHLTLGINKNLDEVQIAQVDKSQLPKSDSYINGFDGEINEFAKKWIESNKAETPNEILKAFYSETLKFLSYGKPIDGLYTYKEALDQRVTDCGGFSTFLGSMLLSQGIPCRLVVGYLYKIGKKHSLKRVLGLSQNFKDITMHAWLEVLQSDGAWFPVDPSVEWKRIHGKSKRLGGFGVVPGDRLVLSYVQNHEFEYQGKKYQFPILQHLEKA